MESAVFAEGGSLKSYRKWILVFVLLLAVGAGGFLLGRETAPDSTTSTLSWMQCDTIYVTILEKQDGNYFHVKGLSVNDVNGQGEYSFSLEDDAKLVWRGRLPQRICRWGTISQLRIVAVCWRSILHNSQKCCK